MLPLPLAFVVVFAESALVNTGAGDLASFVLPLSLLFFLGLPRTLLFHQPAILFPILRNQLFGSLRFFFFSGLDASFAAAVFSVSAFSFFAFPTFIDTTLSEPVIGLELFSRTLSS